MYLTPEQFVARLGYAELLLYCADHSDAPDFSTSSIKKLIRATDYSLAPKFEANVEENVIAGIPDRNLFSVDKVKLEGNIKAHLSSYLQGQLDFPVGMLFEHMRTAWAGVRDGGALISPLSDRLSAHPWFSIGSVYHGVFSQCMVDKMELSVTGGGNPVDLDFKIVATGYNPASAFTIQGLETIANSPEYLSHSRRIVYGRNCTLTSGTTNVVGHFGLPDASNSIFATGMNKPGMPSLNTPTLLTNFSISFENNLEAVYTTKSHEYIDYRKRFSENIFPSAYVVSSPRKIAGQMEWFGNLDGYTFFEQLTGPGSIQNSETLIINCENFVIELKNPVWSLSEKQVGMDKVKRVARFSASTDSQLVIPSFNADYGV